MASRFATSDEDAAQRFQQFKSIDPFPEIPPTLLSSADIEDYVAATGMLYPFDPKEKLKPASYEVDLLGQVTYWTETGHKRTENIKLNKPFKLLKNSIAFVQVEPKFRLPDYIAVRFNLKITHVYRGLLLGTGPLVDPGFEGPLYIPLHNLTNNDYTFVGGEGLIWMEFTKISVSSQPEEDPTQRPSRQGQYAHFPANKKNKELDYYLRKAESQRPIRSSIPEEFRNARNEANWAKRSAFISTGFNFLALLGIVFATFTLLWEMFDYDFAAYLDLRQQYERVQRRTEEDAKQIKLLREDLDSLRSQVAEMEMQEAEN